MNEHGTEMLEILPPRAAGAAENMALDFLLLQRYPRATVPRFRHYGWHGPAFTFGYAQKIEFVRSQIYAGAAAAGDESGTKFDLCRRPTGGGIVDHRNDWTYALVIPRGHPLEELRATQSYQLVHEALAGALRGQGVPCIVKPAATESEGPPSEAPAKEGICFERAEIFDVVHEGSRKKIAGAAQKRNKRGLLFQGSIWKPAAGGDGVDWDRFGDDFVDRLAKALESPANRVPWPDLNEDEVSGLIEQYSSPEWMEFR